MTRARSKRGPAPRIALASLIAVILGVAAAPSSAHTGAYSSPTLYGSGVYPWEYRSTQYYFDDSFVGHGRAKQAVIRSANHWNALGQSLTFTPHPDPQISTAGSFDSYCGGNPQTPPLHVNNSPISLIFWEPIAGPYAGVNNYCLTTIEGQYRPVSFKIGIDSKQTPTWFYGPGAAVPPKRTDLESVATHEFGHATGWIRHYDGPNSLPGSNRCGRDDPERWTMCQNSIIGHAYERSLENHDKHTFTDVY